MWIVVRWLLLTYGSVLLRNLLAQAGVGIPRAVDPVLMVALITLLDAPTGYGFLRSAVTGLVHDLFYGPAIGSMSLPLLVVGYLGGTGLVFDTNRRVQTLVSTIAVAFAVFALSDLWRQLYQPSWGVLAGTIRSGLLDALVLGLVGWLIYTTMTTPMGTARR